MRRGRTPVTPRPAKGTGGRPDLVDRRFQAAAPTRLHVADVFVRRIVGWVCSTGMDTEELPLQALEQAIS